MPAILALPAIYEAIVARLRADTALQLLLAQGAGSVYNMAPTGAMFPYLEVGNGTEIEFNTMGPDGLPKWGAVCTIQITARAQSSGGGSDLPGLKIISRVKALLIGQALTVDGFPSVDVALDVVPPLFTEVIDSRPTRAQPLILRVMVHEGDR